MWQCRAYVKGAREGVPALGTARGRNATSAPAHVAAADTFSLIRLRQRRARLWLAAAGVTSLATIYVGPLAIALRTAGPVTTVSALPALRVPYVSFAQLAVPKLHAAPVVAPAQPALHFGKRHIKTRVPVVTDSYSLAPATAPTKTSSSSYLFSQTPTVDDTVGAPVSMSSTTAPTAAQPAPRRCRDAAGARRRNSARFLCADRSSRALQSVPDSTPATGGGSAGDASDPGRAADDRLRRLRPDRSERGRDGQLGSGAAARAHRHDRHRAGSLLALHAGEHPRPDVHRHDRGPDHRFGARTAAFRHVGFLEQRVDRLVRVLDDRLVARGRDGLRRGAGSGSGTTNGQAGTSGGSASTPAPGDSGTTTPGGVTTPPTDPAATPGSGPSPPAAWIVALSDAAHTISVAVSGDSLVVTVDGVASSRPVASVTSLTVDGGAGDDSFDVSAGALPVPVALSGGAGTDTLHGPAADSTWTISGAGSGSVAGISFAGFENLSGAAGNKDTFVFGAGGGVSGLVDGGQGGYDAIVVAGHPNTVVSNPTDAHSGNLVVDGSTITYTGLEDPDVSAANIVINGGEDSNPSPVPQGDKFVISPYTDPSSPTMACQTAGNCIQVQDFDGPTGTILSVLNYFVIAGTSSLTIHGGAGSDKTEFTGSYLVPNSNLTIDTESIKVDSGFTVDVGTGTVNFNAASADDGTELLGIDTTLLGDGGSIELDSATVNAGTVDFEASSVNAKTTVNGGSQTLTGSGDTLIVATTTPFLDKGKFTIAGITGTCSYSGTSDRTKFTGVSGCTGTPADGAAIASVGILENGSGTGINHAGAPADLQRHDQRPRLLDDHRLERRRDPVQHRQRHGHRERGRRARQGHLGGEHAVQQGRRRHLHATASATTRSRTSTTPTPTRRARTRRTGRSRTRRTRRWPRPCSSPPRRASSPARARSRPRTAT